MRFAFVITNLAGGGAEKAVLKLAAGLACRDHKVEVVVLEDRVEHEVPQGVRVHALCRKASRGWIGKRLLARQLALHLVPVPDLVVSTLPFADEVTSLARIPRHWCRIANTLGSEIDRLTIASPAKGRRRLTRYRQLYGRRPLIAVSSGVAEDLRLRLGVSNRIGVIPNPFDFPAIRLLAAEPCPTRPAGPYILHVGRFAKQKRHDLLLAAFARAELPHQLVLLTPHDPRLDALIAQNGLTHRITVAGFQLNPYAWMAGAELLVLCSDHEGLPNVLIEALACGTRVISTDCPSGPREILAGDLARGLVPCDDTKALALAMGAALTAPRPEPDVIAVALEPYTAERALDAWEALARESS